MNRQIIKVGTTCILIKGASRGCIVDTQRNTYQLVPNTMIDFLTEADGKELDLLLNEYDAESRVVIQEQYISYLLKNEFIFYCSSFNEYQQFPALDLNWDFPAHITNCVIEIDEDSDLEIILQACNGVQVPYLQLIITKEIKAISDLEYLLKRFERLAYRGIQLLFDNACQLSLKQLVDFCNANGRVEMLFAFNAPVNESEQALSCKVILTTQKSFAAHMCGNVGAAYFSLQLHHITESQKYNTCLNRKIAIDAAGEIKNCPSMSRSYGNVRNTTLSEVLDRPDFKALWYIHKDEIAICRDCEFRHLCTDCRAYIENPADQYSKPLKCGYNPYTCEWEEWSTNPLKQQAINYYGIKERI